MLLCRGRNAALIIIRNTSRIGINVEYKDKIQELRFTHTIHNYHDMINVPFYCPCLATHSYRLSFGISMCCSIIWLIRDLSICDPTGTLEQDRLATKVMRLSVLPRLLKCCFSAFDGFYGCLLFRRQGWRLKACHVNVTFLVVVFILTRSKQVLRRGTKVVNFQWISA